jgi:hypothetical protein
MAPDFNHLGLLRRLIKQITDRTCKDACEARNSQASPFAALH